jgi:acyl-coenzyme A thioesterase PaaI-like protein
MTLKPLNPSFEREVRQSFAQQSFMELIGASLTLIEPGRRRNHTSLPSGFNATEWLSARWHRDYDRRFSVRLCRVFSDAEGSGVLSVEFKVNLLRPAKGENFLARAEVIKAGRTLTVVRADVFALTENKRSLVATMQGTMMRL